MKKHVTFEARWKNGNLNLVAENDQCREKSNHRSIVGYGVITNHFGSTTPYKEDLGQKKTSSCLLPNVICLILLLKPNG
jgi:hypothetical protein